MNSVVWGWDRELAAWADARLKTTFSTAPFRAAGVLRDGRVAAAIIYNNYQHPNIHMSIASDTPRWASKEVLRVLFAYPFTQLRCKRVTAVTEATNQPVQAFLCRLGFKREGYHPDLYSSGDGVSFGLIARDAARWLAEENVRQTAQAA